MEVGVDGRYTQVQVMFVKFTSLAVAVQVNQLTNPKRVLLIFIL